nr:polysaccharide biosynthesis C-terminal domain-containing protein [Pseudomonadota bacterium]
VVILPNLSRQHATASREGFSQMLDWALRWALLIGLPATVALVILAGPLLTALFQYGAFDARDVAMASRSLMAYSLGLLAFMLVKVLAPGFYARQDTRTPVRAGIIAMAANMVLNVLLIFPLAHAGLALATSLSSFVNAGLLYWRLRQDDAYRPGADWPGFLARIGVANLLMGAFLVYAAGDLGQWLAANAHERLLHLTWVVFGGLAVYIVAVIAVGLRPRHLRVAADV